MRRTNTPPRRPFDLVALSPAERIALADAVYDSVMSESKAAGPADTDGRLVRLGSGL